MSTTTVTPGHYSIESIGFEHQVVTNSDDKAVGEKEQQHSYQLWVVEGNDSDGYTIQNDLTKRYLGVNGDNVILSEDASLWLFIRLEGQQYFKIQLKGDHDSRVATLTGPSDFDPIVLGNYTGESNELWYPLKRDVEKRP